MAGRLLLPESRQMVLGLAREPAAPSSRALSRSLVVDRFWAIKPTTSSAQRCDFCGVEIDSSHGHLFDRPKRSLVCVCRSCYRLFTNDGAGGAHFRAVPQRYMLVPDAAHAVALWDALQIPIGLSVLFTDGRTGLTTVQYPRPVDATEAALPLDLWRDVERAVPALATMVHDVEALLVRRTETAIDAAVVPIDAWYELLGRIREVCREPKGADENREIDAFFSRVGEMAPATAV